MEIRPSRVEVGEVGWKVCAHCHRDDGGPTWFHSGGMRLKTRDEWRDLCDKCAEIVMAALKEREA